MKFALLLATMLTFALPSPANADATLDTCTMYAEFARAAMQARQEKRSIEQVWPLAAGDKVKEAMLIEAWKKPVWATKPYKDDAVLDFGSTMFLMCMEKLQ